MLIVSVLDVVHTSDGDVGTIVVLLVSSETAVVITMDMELGLDMGLVISVLSVSYSVILECHCFII